MTSRDNKSKKNEKRKVDGVINGDRPQPHNLEAERAVIAAMLRDPDACIDIAMENLGSAEVFYSHAHRELFNALVELKNDNTLGVDLISLAHKLSANDSLEDIGGEVFLAELYDSIATTANLESWCEIVRQFSILRNMISVCSESMIKCYDADTDVKDLVDEIEDRIFKVRHNNTKSEIVSIKESITDTFQNLMDILANKVEPGIPTQYPELNKLIYGFKPGEMFVLAARPSIGKTSLALNFIRHVALKGEHHYPVAFFSLEMTAEQITRRMLCTEAQIQEKAFFDRTFNPREMHKLTKAVDTLRNANIFIDPTAGLTVSELRAKARRLKAQHDIKLIAIDYLQLMKAGKHIESRQQEVAEISSGIKQLAKDLNVPVLVLAQLNREIEKNAGAKAVPKLSHLRESGAIEQDADLVVFLHRDRDEAKDRVDDDHTKGLDSMLIVEKNRNGQTGRVELSFFPERMEFVSKSRYSDEDRPSDSE
jgi:replicative DNA helicase